MTNNKKPAEKTVSLKDALPGGKVLDASAFPESPFRAEKKAIAERNKAARTVAQPTEPTQREAMRTWHQSQARYKRDYFAVKDEEARQSMKRRGLMLGFIREDEVQDYLNDGARLARRSDFDNLRDNVIEDGKGLDGVLRRREMVGVIMPKEWHEDRLEAASGMAQAQLNDFENKGDTEGVYRLGGHFGKQGPAIPPSVMAEAERRVRAKLGDSDGED